MKRSRHWRILAAGIAFSLALPAPVWGQASLQPAPAFTQLLSNNRTSYNNRYASQAARNSGLRSIGRGRGNMKSGKAKGAAGAAQVALGAMQLALGILGMMAAQKAAQNADKAEANAQSLAEIGTDGRDGTGSSSLLASGQGDSSVAKGPKATISLGSEANQALIELQDEFGIPANDFAAALAAGRDPRWLLVNAPQNPLAAEDAKEAHKLAMADSLVDTRGLAQQAAATPAKEAVAKAEAAPAPLTPGLKPQVIDDGEELSPELQAALSAKDKANGVGDLTLFDVIHTKYQHLFSLGSR